MTVADLIAMHGWGFIHEEARSGLYRCRITCEDRGIDFIHKSSAVPTLGEALARIAKSAHQSIQTNLGGGNDASSDVASFRFWCQQYGYDPDSKVDHQRYVTIRRRREELEYVIGTQAFKTLLEVVPSGQQGLGGLVEIKQEELDSVPDGKQREQPAGYEATKAYICDSCGRISTPTRDKERCNYCGSATHVSTEDAVEVTIPKCEFGTDFIAVVYRGKVVDILLLADRTSVYDSVSGCVQGYVNNLQLVDEFRETTDIEVKYGNNVYLVRLTDGVPHIMIPAMGMSSADSYLSTREREAILRLALSNVPCPPKESAPPK